MPGSSIRTASLPSSTAPRMSASSRTARRSRRQFIENKLKFSPYIREAVAFGDQQAFVAAMIAIDISTVGKWAEQRGHALHQLHGSRRQARRRDADPRGGRARSTRTLPDALKVRRIVLLNKELDADDAEITRTRKVRRGFVAEKYAPVIERVLRRRHAGAAHHGHHLRGRPQEQADVDPRSCTMSMRSPARGRSAETAAMRH